MDCIDVFKDGYIFGGALQYMNINVNNIVNIYIDLM